MRRFVSYLLIAAVLALPLMTSCFPSGYKKNDKNPAKPPGNQVTGSQLPAPKEQPKDDTSGGADTSGGSNTSGSGNTSGGGK
jgi:hypothetical protein